MAALITHTLCGRVAPEVAEGRWQARRPFTRVHGEVPPTDCQRAIAINGSQPGLLLSGGERQPSAGRLACFLVGDRDEPKARCSARAAPVRRCDQLISKSASAAPGAASSRSWVSTAERRLQRAHRTSGRRRVSGGKAIFVVGCPTHDEGTQFPRTVSTSAPGRTRGRPQYSGGVREALALVTS